MTKFLGYLGMFLLTWPFVLVLGILVNIMLHDFAGRLALGIFTSMLVGLLLIIYANRRDNKKSTSYSQ